MEVVVGNRIKVIVDSIIDKNENIIKEIKKECDGKGSWSEFHFPLKEVS